MKLVSGKKMKMSQLWTDEKVQPFTEVKLGSPEDLAQFVVGQKVKVRGRSKGKGYTGVMKRHHFRGGPATHGQSDRQRAPGAIGSSTTPGRVLKGKRMSGRSGFSFVSLKTKVLEIDGEKQLLRLLGALPGAYGSVLTLNTV